MKEQNKGAEARKHFDQLTKILVEADIADGMDKYLRRIDEIIWLAFEADGDEKRGTVSIPLDEAERYQLDRERP